MGRGDRYVGSGLEGIRVVSSKKPTATKVERAQSGVWILKKEICRPGRYVDEDGFEFEPSAEDLVEYVQGTKELIASGFRINGFPDHSTNKSTEKLGEWLKVWIDDDARVWGLFEPKDAEAEKVALQNDSSAIYVDGLDLGEMQIKRAMPRIDIVPQGAVIGTEPFQRVSQALANRFKAARVFAAAACQKEKTMKSRLALLLSHALMGEAVDDEGAVIDSLKQHLMSSRGLQSEELEFGDEDLSDALVEMLTSAKAASGDGAEDEEPGDEAEGEIEDVLGDLEGELEGEEEEVEMSTRKTSAQSAGKGDPRDQLNRELQAQVEELQMNALEVELNRARKLSARTTPIAVKTLGAIKACYSQDRKAFGHKTALARAKKEIGLHLNLAKARAATKGRKLERPKVEDTKKTSAPTYDPEDNPLLKTKGGPWQRNGTA